ncbi:MAG TPA: FtsX-like permease family protein [Nitrospira sp.]|nr:FtsX-like permease family protein [Nitrospira sp.]
MVQSLTSVLLRAHVQQRPFRALLSVIGVALGVLASVAIGAANVEVLRSFERAVTSVAGSSTLEILGHDLGVDETVIAAVRRVPGVVAASPLLEGVAVAAAGDHRWEGIEVYGLDLIAEGAAKGFDVEADRERVLDALLSPDAVYLGHEVASAWQLRPGDRLDVIVGGRSARLRVAGFLHAEGSRSSLWNEVAVMDIAAAQLLFSSIGRLDRIDVVTTPDASLDQVAASLRAVLPPHLVVQRPAQRTKQVENMVRSFQLNLTVLSWVGLLIGTFLIYNTMAFAVAQRRREIGIYRALGMAESRVAGLFLLEGGLLGFMGGLLGGIGGVWLSQTLVSLVSRTITDLYVPVGSGSVLSWDSGYLGSVWKGILFGSVVAMIGSLAPSLEASRTITVRALAPGDYEESQQMRSRLLLGISVVLAVVAGATSLMGPIAGLPLFGYVATLSLLASLACLSPVFIQALGYRRAGRDAGPRLESNLRRIAADHAARHPGRNAVTVSALMVGLAIMIGVVVMVRSFRETVEAWVNETVMADLVVAPPTWLQGKQVGHAGRSFPDSLIPQLASVDGVAAVDPYRDVQVIANGQTVALVSRDLKLHAERGRYVMMRGDYRTILNHAAESEGVLISEVLANRLGVNAGSTLTLVTPQGPQTIPVVGVFYDYATDGGKVVMDRRLYRRLWDDDKVTVFGLYLLPGADGELVRRSIVRLFADDEGQAVPPAVIRNKDLRHEILEIFDRTFVLTYVLEIIAVLVAVLGIVNTLVTAVLERRREFATLQAIGASTVQVERLVLWEAVYLGIIGAVLGVVGGLVLAWILIYVINKQSFGWTIRMTVPVGLLLEAVVLAIATAWIAGYFPARWAARQPVVEGLRDE